jgi:hypothetical protein
MFPWDTPPRLGSAHRDWRSMERNSPAPAGPVTLTRFCPIRPVRLHSTVTLTYRPSLHASSWSQPAVDTCSAIFPRGEQRRLRPARKYRTPFPAWKAAAASARGAQAARAKGEWGGLGIRRPGAGPGLVRSCKNLIIATLTADAADEPAAAAGPRRWGRPCQGPEHSVWKAHDETVPIEKLQHWHDSGLTAGTDMSSRQVRGVARVAGR